jgi:anthranilate phosphoribosyltransferase
MNADFNREFGLLVTKLIRKENLSREETKSGIETILTDRTSEMQQGGFLAALCCKGETKEEVAGSWEAIYEHDTIKVEFKPEMILVENCGTGMDSFKTFNISTAASIVAAAGNVTMARHGARAITSASGTVDIAEKLGVDVECSAEIVKRSIEKTGIGLFNGMSPETHPHALGRILSQIYFGTTLNIAASLANPAMPKYAVRGVYSKEMIIPVIDVMKEIGYRRALAINGSIKNSNNSMDEASVCGITYSAELSEKGIMNEFEINPQEFGLGLYSPEELSPLPNQEEEVLRFLKIIAVKMNGACLDSVILNSALIFYISGRTDSIYSGVELSELIIKNGSALNKLKEWVMTQNRNPETGIQRLSGYLKRI